jgi:hypothetical protein
MNSLLFALTIIGASVLATVAEAQNYPWCARMNMGDETVNCGFVSFDQCMTYLSGGAANGYCIENNTYKPPPTESVTAETTAPAQAAAPAAKKPQRHTTSSPAQGTGPNH